MTTKTETCTECGKDIEVEQIIVRESDRHKIEFVGFHEYNFVCIRCAVDRMGEE